MTITKFFCGLAVTGIGAMVYFYTCFNNTGYIVASFVTGAALLYLISTSESCS